MTMTVEEKAKAYDAALERAKDYIEKQNPPVSVLYEIFPEIKESEDEKIRKALGCNNVKGCVTCVDGDQWAHYKEVEQKPVDNSEPKFHEGDWVLNDACLPIQIASVEDDMYVFSDASGMSTFFVDKNYHLWTIQDAEEGDVLYFDDKTIVIFKDLYNSTTFHSYCHIEDGIFDISKDEMPDWWEGKGFVPATKEQCDTLFTKMKEAGFEWDSEKKELKRIEQKPILDFKASNWYVSKVDGKIHDMTYNPTDKVEPKFKVGDFIVNDYCMGRVVEIANDAYLLDTEQGIPFSCEHNIHLWTIADANDGDVLVSRHGNPLIYNGNYNSLNIGAYCGMTCDDNKFKVAEEKCHWTENVDIKPSTKEQRDLLFAKMKEAGYEWDAENKELKKIEQKDFVPKEDIDVEKKSKLTPFDKKIRDFLFSFYREASDGISLNEMIDGANKLNTMLGNAEQKSAWSEEDKEMFKLCVDAVEYYYTTEENRIHKWLQSLKNRVQLQNLTVTDEELSQAKKEAYNDALNKIEYHSGEPTFDDGWSAAIWYLKKRNIQPQPKQEWSDEDERERKRIIGLLEGWLSTFKETCYAEDCKCGIDWLKSLKERITYKPSEEQIHAFEQVYEWYNNNFAPSETLTSLYNDLKKFEYRKKII